jgi:hypothetical protein
MEVFSLEVVSYIDPKMYAAINRPDLPSGRGKKA